MPCLNTTTGPARLQCRRNEGHDGGHRYDAGDVDDGHTDSEGTGSDG